MGLRTAAGLACLAAFGCLSAQAQSTFGSILGKVTDPTGAVVPGARIVVTNEEQNTSREVRTDELGNYEAANLKAGRYTVAASAGGFRQHRVQALALEARQTLRLDISMLVGQVDERVTVTAEATVVTTDTSTIASSFSARDVLSLPANFRASGSTSPFGLFALLPGIQPGAGPSAGYTFSIQGALPDHSDFTVDGISTMNIRLHRPSPEIMPSVELISEMKVQGVGNNAEFSQPGDVTTTTKSGANSYHGSLFEYLQNRALDAKPYDSPAKPPKTINTFGGSLGGPLVRNRTFFFTGYEGLRRPSYSTVINTVPTAAQRRGEFSAEGVAVRDPLTSQPFAGNRIPDSRFSSIARAILDRFYPLPNFGRSDVETPANYRDNRSNPLSSNQYDARLDHVLARKHTVFARWSWKNIGATAPNPLLLPANDNINRGRNLVVSHNFTARPNLLSEFRAGYTWDHYGDLFSIDGAQFIKEVGLQGFGPDFPAGGMPQVAFSGITTTFDRAYPRRWHNRTIQFHDNVTWIAGRHTAKFGGGARQVLSNQINGGMSNYGQFAFRGAFTRNDFADFLLGIPDNSRFSNSRFNTFGTSWETYFFLQDSFKISPKLTLEYGLRWDYNSPMVDPTSDISNFDRSVPRAGRVVIPSTQRAKDITGPTFVKSINACPGPATNGIPCTAIVPAREIGWPESLRFPDKNNFNPRFGFAWRPFANTRTVLRGGAGVFSMPMMGTFFYSLTAIHSVDRSTYTNALVDGAPLFQWPQTKVGAGVFGNALGTQDLSTMIYERFRDPYSVQWNLTAERDLGWNTGLRVSYVALRSLKMTYAGDLNQPANSTTPFAQRPLTDRPFPNFNKIYSREQGGNAIYHSMQVEANRRFSGGLTFNSAWTWAKNLADYNGPVPEYFANENGGNRLSNSYDRRADRGDVVDTPRHRWVTTSVFHLPFGRGRRFAAGAHPVVDAFLGGWRVSNILALQTGRYLTARMGSGDPSGTGAPGRGAQRPDALRNGNLANPAMERWFDRSAFVCPGRTPGAADQFNCNVTPIARFGNAGVGALLGPGSWGLSTGFAKDFRIRERMTLKFESTWTNVLNHPNFNEPITAIDSAAFGKISGKSGNRIGQFGLRVEF